LRRAPQLASENRAGGAVVARVKSQSTPVPLAQSDELVMSARDAQVLRTIGDDYKRQFEPVTGKLNQIADAVTELRALVQGVKQSHLEHLNGVVNAITNVLVGHFDKHEAVPGYLVAIKAYLDSRYFTNEQLESALAAYDARAKPIGVLERFLPYVLSMVLFVFSAVHQFRTVLSEYKAQGQQLEPISYVWIALLVVVFVLLTITFVQALVKHLKQHQDTHLYKQFLGVYGFRDGCTLPDFVNLCMQILADVQSRKRSFDGKPPLTTHVQAPSKG
jgi:hypothetical protein